MTHDSIGLGEDGPTHQPVEKFLMCRSTPNLQFIRPADVTETSAAYIAALRKRQGPTVMALSRQVCHKIYSHFVPAVGFINLFHQQNLPPLNGSSIEGALKGGYVLQDPEGKPDIIFVSTGSEVSIAVQAAGMLKDKKVFIINIEEYVSSLTVGRG